MSFSLFPLLPIQPGKRDSPLFKISPQTHLFALFNHIPLPILLSIIPLFLIPSFFLTSTHSPTFLLPIQTTFPSLNPTTLVKLTSALPQPLIPFLLLLPPPPHGSKPFN
ncbi:BCCT family transporter, partial [Staphylococcus epidermidis]|uniref:BCCT family transporter n=1 Tax=Staphylococcus epidermidis TaxID=1282 RepID=UPI0037DA6987